MSQEQRFTAWLSSEERAAIENEAREMGTTMNFVVRLAVRKYFGLRIHRERSEVVTPVTRHN